MSLSYTAKKSRGGVVGDDSSVPSTMTSPFLVPCRGSTSLTHYRPGSHHPIHFDNYGGSKDSGIR